VASYLGNTPAVCRSSYIDPRVFDRFRDGETIRAALDQSIGQNGVLPSARGAVEKAVLRLIGYSRCAAASRASSNVSY
jgi:DNA topoisomerase IB